MNSEQLFKMALGIESPWEVVGVEFKAVDGEAAKALHVDSRDNMAFSRRLSSSNPQSGQPQGH